ncbi:VapE domain-containing protein [Klebsiella pneumoniae]|uniref:VapE domain-containing protein n=1 Tax=Klebsiella pneumoniae TaxID=573 RepID=UPI000E2BA825|nr:VapE domain-containing protein [Klebsiella pneumoniae]SVY08949.1 Predicted P-loop ATPase and inactivated derivatives [Klebsiella pneumoniae]HDY9182060.1 bifunctional DNA primase/polymerase [Klebsiella pneumoniae]
MADIVKRGTTPEQWDLAVALFGRENLIPIASEGELSPNSSLDPKSVGKVPSVHNSSGKIVGFKDWSAYRASDADIVRWKRRGYGIGLILGRDRGDGYALHALDADTAIDAHQDAVYEELFRHLSVYLPYRGRDNSARRAYLVWAPPVPKHVHSLPEENGKAAAIELLGVGQQVATFGPHPSGSDYTWYDDPLLGNEYTLTPEDIPVLGAEALAAFWASLKDRLPVVDSYVAGVRRLRDLTDNDPGATDDVADWLDANGWTLSVSSDGSRNLKPFRDESGYSNGCSETSIKYFPAGTGGFQQGHFKSMHATDTGLSDTEWLDGYGYRVDDFEDLTSTEVSEPAPLPPFRRDNKGAIEAIMDNVAMALLRPDFTGVDIRYDIFRDAIMLAPKGSDGWRAFGDEDYSELRVILSRRSFKEVNKELMRDAVFMVAKRQPFDSATTWLNGLEWDGVPRIEHFYHTHFGTADTPYTRAVSLYMWTALAGRVLEPGIKADMVPILVGAQGLRKSAGIAALSPDPEFFADISFADKDDDLARKMRGCLVAEISELRGLNTKDLESIKAWVTRTHDKWVPKFKEFTTIFARRGIPLGSSNEDEFLADKTGNRRWLPVDVIEMVSTDAIVRDRELLWAEARETFKRLGGIQFRDAERLGASVHEQYTIKDAWLETVEKWLDTPDLMTNEIPRNCEFLRASDVLRDAIGLDPRHIGKREEMRISNVLQNCGYKRAQRRIDGKMTRIFEPV